MKHRTVFLLLLNGVAAVHPKIPSLPLFRQTCCASHACQHLSNPVRLLTRDLVLCRTLRFTTAVTQVMLACSFGNSCIAIDPAEQRLSTLLETTFGTVHQIRASTLF